MKDRPGRASEWPAPSECRAGRIKRGGDGRCGRKNSYNPTLFEIRGKTRSKGLEAEVRGLP